MTTFSFYSFRIIKISPYINFKKIISRILAPPSGRRPGAAAPSCPPRYATVWQQLLKSIHYRTLLISLNKKTTDLRVKTWGNKRHVIPPLPCQNMGGYITPSPHPLGIYALARLAEVAVDNWLCS